MPFITAFREPGVWRQIAVNIHARQSIATNDMVDNAKPSIT